MHWNCYLRIQPSSEIHLCWCRNSWITSVAQGYQYQGLQTRRMSVFYFLIKISSNFFESTKSVCHEFVSNSITIKSLDEKVIHVQVLFILKLRLLCVKSDIITSCHWTPRYKKSQITPKHLTIFNSYLCIIQTLHNSE